MKKLLFTILFTLVLSGGVRAEVVKLNCTSTENKISDFVLTLNYEKSLLIDKFNRTRHMEFDEDTIIASAPNMANNADVFSYFMYSLSRLSGKGSMKAYKINLEEYETIILLAEDEIIKQNVTNEDDKSLDWAREVIFAEKLNEFLLRKIEKLKIIINCKKAEQKF